MLTCECLSLIAKSLKSTKPFRSTIINFCPSKGISGGLALPLGPQLSLYVANNQTVLKKWILEHSQSVYSGTRKVLNWYPHSSACLKNTQKNLQFLFHVRKCVQSNVHSLEFYLFTCESVLVVCRIQSGNEGHGNRYEAKWKKNLVSCPFPHPFILVASVFTNKNAKGHIGKNWSFFVSKKIVTIGTLKVVQVV